MKIFKDSVTEQDNEYVANSESESKMEEIMFHSIC